VVPTTTTTTKTDTAALAARLRLAVTRLARKLRREAEPGISPSMLAALSSVDRQGPLTMSELCVVEQVQPPSMTRIVAALVDVGLVSRESDPSDGRVAWVTVTPQGRKLLDRSRGRKEAYLAKALRDLEAHELETLEEAAAILEGLTGGQP